MLPVKPVRRKLVISSIWAMWSRPGPMAGSALTSPMARSFNLSNNARMALDEFVYDPDGTSNSTLFNLTKGTFTFVAGNIAKTGDMKVDTPVATMGIRGTTPHVEILDDGTVKFSTLIEEGKSKLTKKPVAPAAPQPEQKAQAQAQHLSRLLGISLGASCWYKQTGRTTLARRAQRARIPISESEALIWNSVQRKTASTAGRS